MASTDAAPWHVLDVEAVRARAETDLHDGLAADEAARRLVATGPNRLAETKPRARWRLFLDQFANLLVLLLVVAAVVMLLIGERVDAAAIAAILILNAVLGYAQEAKAADAIAALRRMTAPRARVRRGGATAEIAAADLVPGDLVVLEAGDRIAADLRLVRGSGLRLVEAALTGESEPVDKRPVATVSAHAALADRTNMAWTGTTVAAGSGTGVVVATGTATELGRIAGLVESAEEEATPLQRRLASFGRLLAIGSGVVVVLVFALGVLRGVDAVEMLLAAVSLAVAAVPEGLPAVVTIALAVGVSRMAARNALIRRLPAVETLGSTTVIASDKTGTLTTGVMTLREVVTLDDRVTLEGEGAARGFRRDDDPVDLGPDEGVVRVLHAGVAASTARLAVIDGETVPAGDPTEGAIVVAAAVAGLDAEALDDAEPERARHDFDADRKRMSIIRDGPDGLRAWVKGAPESLLARCDRVLVAGVERPLTAADRVALDHRNTTMAERGLRILAVAQRALDAPPGSDEPDGSPAERDLVLLGLVGLADPPRPDAAAAVAACRAAGIRVLMITGDQPATAAAIAREIGLAEAETRVVAGRELDGWTDADLEEQVESIGVYARVSPEHKLRIVRAWKARGHVVAMTGDGVNDAPALKGADIGVAMGLGGTEVARDASDMVLTDDAFPTIVAAIAEGRRIFENIRKTLLYLLSGNFAEILVMAVAVVAGWPLPLLPIQLLWINLVTDGLPALALAVDPADPDVLKARPPEPGGALADRAFGMTVLITGCVVAACTLVAFLHGLRTHGDPERARAMAFTTLVVAEVMKSFAFRSRRRTLWQVGVLSNLHLALVVVGSLALQAVILLWEPLGSILKVGAFHPDDLAWVIVLGLVPVSLLEIRKMMRRGADVSP